MLPTLVIVLFMCENVLGNTHVDFEPNIDERIVGGEPTVIVRHPYQLSLRHYNIPICGATIISANWALTAAHCLKNRLADDISINAGSTFVHQTESIHKAKRTLIHPHYKNVDYDFALIEVTVPFPIGQPNIQPIELATVEPKQGDLAEITGWGNLETKESSPEQLQVVAIPIISRDMCTELYSHFYDITDRMICAFTVGVGKDACQGDSGGPLVVDRKLAGVVSDGIGCGLDGFPGIYSNVANQVDWIKNITGL